LLVEEGFLQCIQLTLVELALALARALVQEQELGEPLRA
jgi:hypothetical protein